MRQVPELIAAGWTGASPVNGGGSEAGIRETGRVENNG